jgi:hypothetical protein
VGATPVAPREGGPPSQKGGEEEPDRRQRDLLARSFLLRSELKDLAERLRRL